MMLNPLITTIADQFAELRKTVEKLEEISLLELTENDYRILYALAHDELPYFKDQLEGLEDCRFGNLSEREELLTQ